jgi:hypothetical protein
MERLDDASEHSSPNTRSHTSTLVGELGFSKDNEPLKPLVGLDLQPVPPASNVATFECGGVQETVAGSVIGSEPSIDKMSSAFPVKFAQGTASSSRRRSKKGRRTRSPRRRARVRPNRPASRAKQPTPPKNRSRSRREPSRRGACAGPSARPRTRSRAGGSCGARTAASTAQPVSANRGQRPGTPFSWCAPRSSN